MKSAFPLCSTSLGEEFDFYDAFRLHGAGKKHKKKTYTTPKKNKHKKKKDKLAILKYYVIHGDGSVVHTHYECKNCGAGVFMAQHKDRMTCGKCGLTYVNSKSQNQ